MIRTILELTCRDPLVSRDGRPFGMEQGNRMRGLAWLLPSVVAGSFRTALVKAHPNLDFSGDIPQRLQRIHVAGVFPAVGEELYLPAPNDCLWNDQAHTIHRVQPVAFREGEGGDFPEAPLQPVMLKEEQAPDDFKPQTPPAWWPLRKYAQWLTDPETSRASAWFDSSFLNRAFQESREHVKLDAGTGAAEESRLFATTGLTLTCLPRFGVQPTLPQAERCAAVTLTARVTLDDRTFDHLTSFQMWHPLGGERRLVHWKSLNNSQRWSCPHAVGTTLKHAKQVRMVLATPAIFREGWKPGWLDGNLEGSPPGSTVTLKLVGVGIQRWRAVSGWSLAVPRGPKPIRRMVPAGGVYYFTLINGHADALTSCWLESVCDDEQDRRDGFGLAVWGTW
ncbi:MAG: hypothetical protein D6690_09820 [Nitrospirae bacterium]|nr:MAG: hypothetical protein D6690_09820 [Nitrospirota bacterium]